MYILLAMVILYSKEPNTKGIKLMKCGKNNKAKRYNSILGRLQTLIVNDDPKLDLFHIQLL